MADTKEIRMPYSEYEEMTDLIKKLSEDIKILTRKEGNDLPVIDYRYEISIRIRHYFQTIPRIHPNANELLEKLANEFDSMHREMKKMELENGDLKSEIEKTREKVKHKRWWQ